MDIELKFSGPGHYKGTYRGIDFAVKKDGEGRYNWRIHYAGAIIEGPSPHRAAQYFMHLLDLEPMALPLEADALFNKLAQRIRAAGSVSLGDERTLLELERLSWNLEDMWATIRQAVIEIDEFEARTNGRPH